MSKLITSFHAELNEASYSSSIPREWQVANEFERILGGASLRPLPRMPFWNSPCTAFIPLHLQFTIDRRPDLWYGCACYLEQTRRHAAPLTPLDSALPRNLAFCTVLVQISRLESTLTDTSLVTPLECTLTKTPEEGVSPPSSVPCCVSVVNPLLSSVCSLFALFLRPPSFVFSNLEPLSAKHPGGGYPNTSAPSFVPPSHAARGASIPCAVSRLRILPVTTGACVPPTRFRFLCGRAGSNCLALCFHILTNCCFGNPFLSQPSALPGGGGADEF